MLSGGVVVQALPFGLWWPGVKSTLTFLLSCTAGGWCVAQEKLFQLLVDMLASAPFSALSSLTDDAVRHCTCRAWAVLASPSRAALELMRMCVRVCVRLL
jgi:hypothetical protein